jgi:hypothetical protein
VCIVCVDLCTVFRLIVELFCVICVCLIVVRLPPGRNPFSVKINNNNNNNNNKVHEGQGERSRYSYELRAGRQRGRSS